MPTGKSTKKKAASRKPASKKPKKTASRTTTATKPLRKKTAKKKASASAKPAKKAVKKAAKKAAKITVKNKAKKKAVKKAVAKKSAVKKKLVKKKAAKKTAKKTVAKKAAKPVKQAASVRKLPVKPLMVEPGPPPGPIPPVEEPARNEEALGVVTHYYSHLGVAIVQVNRGTLKTGDTIHITGHATDFSQKVESMEYEHQHIEEASAGMNVGIKVADHAREHDILYLVR